MESNIIRSKSNFSLSQVKKMLDAHKNTLMKFFNTAMKRQKVDNLTTDNAVLKTKMADLKSSKQFHFDTTKGELLEVDTNVSQVKLLLMTIRKL